jgi:hypothetical protein
MRLVFSSVMAALRRRPQQQTPVVTANDVHREFSADHFDGVMSVLNEYGAESWHRERDRVQLAVLKLAQGNEGTLRKCIDTAKQDRRDVLAPAEYSEYMRRGMFLVKDLPLGEHRRIIDGDWRQYEYWLRK